MLIAITLSICGIVILLLIFETAVPYLRGIVIKERDSENPYGKDVCLTNNKSCYNIMSIIILLL